jgi:hypothetical protein
MWENIPTLDRLMSMRSDVRIQYIIDRYLKQEKNKPKKFQKAKVYKDILEKSLKNESIAKKNLKEYYKKEKQDFKDIVESRIFTKEDLLKYYSIRNNGNIPQELDQDFEKFLIEYKEPTLSRREEKAPETSRFKYTPLNFDDEKFRNEYFYNLEKKEQKTKLGREIKLTKEEEKLRKKGFLINKSGTSSKALVGMLNLQKNINKKNRNLENLNLAPGRSDPSAPGLSKDSLVWKKQMNAENYKNRKYQNTEGRSSQAYFTNRQIKKSQKDEKDFLSGILERALRELKIENRPEQPDIKDLRKRIKELSIKEQSSRKKAKPLYASSSRSPVYSPSSISSFSESSIELSPKSKSRKSSNASNASNASKKSSSSAKSRRSRDDIFDGDVSWYNV